MTPPAIAPTSDLGVGDGKGEGNGEGEDEGEGVVEASREVSEGFMRGKL